MRPLSRLALNFLLEGAGSRETSIEGDQHLSVEEPVSDVFESTLKSFQCDSRTLYDKPSLRHGEISDHEAILNSREYFDELESLTFKVIKSSSLSEILPEGSIRFVHQGLIVPDTVLFDAALFSSLSIKATPRAWLLDFRDRCHHASFEPPREVSSDLRDLTEEQQSEVGLTTILASMRLLKLNNFCNGDFRIITPDSKRHQVAMVDKITRQEMHDLTNAWRHRDDVSTGGVHRATVESKVKGRLVQLVWMSSNNNVPCSRSSKHIFDCVPWLWYLILDPTASISVRTSGRFIRPKMGWQRMRPLKVAQLPQLFSSKCNLLV